jgi:hypothetical protein
VIRLSPLAHPRTIVSINPNLKALADRRHTTLTHIVFPLKALVTLVPLKSHFKRISLIKPYSKPRGHYMNNIAKTVLTNRLLVKTPFKWILSAAGSFAICLSVGGSAALGELPAQGQARYEARQNISYELGSKFTSGFFVRHAGACMVTLMVVEKSPPDNPLPVTAARVRLTLLPGQIGGLDSEEGSSLNFTCTEGAAALLVDIGERDKLVTLQRNAQAARGGAS